MPDLAALTFDAPTVDSSQGNGVFFAFESDFVASLRCIPMCVRLKLDRAGIKLSLRQWSRFTRQDRQDLADAPCSSLAEISAYRGRLQALVRERADEAARALTEPVDPLWARVDQVPTSVVAFALQSGVAAPNLSQWAALSELQRFALVKLSRENHDNVNFRPALSEFGISAHSERAIGALENGPPRRPLGASSDGVDAPERRRLPGPGAGTAGEEVEPRTADRDRRAHRGRAPCWVR